MIKSRISYSNNIVTDGLVFYYDAANPQCFDGNSNTVRDLSGNNNNGTLINGVGYSNLNRGGFVFDGVNDGINIPHNSIIDIRNRITMECFFYLNSFIAGGNYSDTITLVTKAYSYYMSINVSSKKLVTYFYGTGGYYSSNSLIILNQWTHVAITFSNNVINWYLNSVLDKTENKIGSIIPTQNGDLGIGSEIFNNYGRNINGRISMVRLYNKALTQQEITQNFNATKSRYGL